MSPASGIAVMGISTNAAPEVLPEAKPGQPLVAVEGVLFDDFTHAMWETVCDDPDAAEPSFSPARCLDIGFLRCKPTVKGDGGWIFWNYDQDHDRYGYSLSNDGGKTLSHRYGPKKLATAFDEAMSYERADGSIRMLARSALGVLAECISHDGGLTFSEARESDIPNPNTRFFISRTPTGRLLLILNDDARERKNMSAWLSEDDGVTWPHRLLLDGRTAVSYPDADFHDGRIYITYDRERTGAKEILFLSLTEEDIIAGRTPEVTVVSKP